MADINQSKRVFESSIEPQPSFRSSTVARMAGLPVATLRIWEQRYQAVRPSTAPSGHRLYSLTDVERVTLLRRLTQQGHAIRLLASLNNEQMHAMYSALAPDQTPVDAELHVSSPLRPLPMRIVVVGQAMAVRLQRLAAHQAWASALQWVGSFDTLSDAIQAAKNSRNKQIDLLLWQAASLHIDRLPELRSAKEAWGAQTAAVAYQYSSTTALTALVNAGHLVVRELADDASLSRWLATLTTAEMQTKAVRSKLDGRANVEYSMQVQPSPQEVSVSAPRFGNIALMEFAQLSSGIACECPSHLAELLLQITSFESYSSDCAHRNAADAHLHTELQQVAGAARMLFEKALERVAIAEGLPLPSNLENIS